MTEGALLARPLELTNEPYAIAKIAGTKLCQAYRRQYGCDCISAMPLRATTTAVTAFAATIVAMAAARLRVHIFSPIATVVAMVPGQTRPRAPFAPQHHRAYAVRAPGRATRVGGGWW